MKTGFILKVLMITLLLSGGLSSHLLAMPQLDFDVDGSVYREGLSLCGSCSTSSENCNSRGCSRQQKVKATITAHRVADIPEPKSLALICLGLVALLLSRTKKP